MSFTLGDVENDILREIGSQNPPANYGVGGSLTYPNWGAVQGTPLVGQGLVDAAINNAVTKAISGLRWTDLVNYSYTFASNALQYSYPFPGPSNAQGWFSITGNPVPGITLSINIDGAIKFYTTTLYDTNASVLLTNIIGQINQFYPVTANIVFPLSLKIDKFNAAQITAVNPGSLGSTIPLAVTSSSGAITITASGPTLTGGQDFNPLSMELRRLTYAPFGQLYRRDELAGIRLVSWQQMSIATGGGFAKDYTFATEPNIVAMTPDRTSLQFWPGPSQSGDLITVYYVPQLTVGSGEPMLTTQGSVVPFPDDCRDLIVAGAMQWIWPVMQEFGMRDASKKMFHDELLRIASEWERGSSGETMRMIDADDARSMFI